MSIDELKALCLMDCENLYQQEAAERMGVSRQTFGNILASARRKCTQMLVKGLTLVIEGGNVCSCDCEDDEKPCYCRRNSEQETVERSGEES